MNHSEIKAMLNTKSVSGPLFRDEEGFHMSSNPAHCFPPSLDQLNLRYLHFISPIQECFLGSRVLDLGCHNGKFSHAAIRLGAKEVVGVDKNPAYIEEAKHKVPQGKFYEEDILNVDLGKFDVVLCLSVLYYVEPLPLLQKLRKICNQMLVLDTFTMPYPDQGVLIGTVPNQWMLEKWIVESGFSFELAKPSQNMNNNYKTGLRASYWCKPLRIML